MSLFYRFGDFVLDPRRRSLSRAGSNVSLTSKAFDVLHFLVQNPNRLITKEELLQSVWGDAFVDEGNLTQYISHLRKALGDNTEDARLIVTVVRKGYQFTVDVTVTETPDEAKQSAVQVRPFKVRRPTRNAAFPVSRMRRLQQPRCIGGKLRSRACLRYFWLSSASPSGGTLRA